MTPARPASSEPPANTMVKTRGTSWPSALTMLGCVSAAWMIRPMRVFFSSSQMVSSMPRRDQQHEAAIGREVLAVQREQREVERGGTRYGIGSMPHAICTARPMMNTRPNVNSSSAMCPLWWTRRSPHTSIAAPIAPHSNGAMIRAGQKPTQRLISIGEVGAQHVDAGVGEVQHAHHAEDQRKPARQHEQQHAVDEAIQQGDQADLHDARVTCRSAQAGKQRKELYALGSRFAGMTQLT